MNKAQTRSSLQYLKIRFLLLLVLFISCQQDSTSILARDALKLSMDGGQDRWQKSRNILENCIKRGETDPHVIDLYILTLYRVGDWERAKKISLQQIASDPRHFFTNYLLAKIHYEERRYHTALEYLLRCRNIKPEHLDTLIMMANCASRINSTLALSIYMKLTETPACAADFLTYNGLAVNFAQTGNLINAVSAFSKAELLANDHPLVTLNFAIVNDISGNQDIARRHYIRFLTLSKNNFKTQRLRVQQILKRIKA